MARKKDKVLTPRTNERRERAVEKIERFAPSPRDPGEEPRPPGRPDALGLLLESFTENDQIVRAVVLRGTPELKALRVSLRGDVTGGTNWPDSAFRLRIGAGDAAVVSQGIKPDATAKEMRDALVEGGLFERGDFSVRTAPEEEEFPRGHTTKYGPAGQWYLDFTPEFLKRNGITRDRHGRQIRKPPALTAESNDLAIPQGSELTNHVHIQRVRAVPTRTIIDVGLDIPYYGITTGGLTAQLQQGLLVSCRWKLGLGYVIEKAENYFLRLRLDQPRR